MARTKAIQKQYEVDMQEVKQKRTRCKKDLATIQGNRKNWAVWNRIYAILREFNISETKYQGGTLVGDDIKRLILGATEINMRLKEFLKNPISVDGVRIGREYSDADNVPQKIDEFMDKVTVGFQALGGLSRYFSKEDNFTQQEKNDFNSLQLKFGLYWQYVLCMSLTHKMHMLNAHAWAQILRWGSFRFGNEQTMESLHCSENETQKQFKSIWNEEDRNTAIEKKRHNRSDPKVQQHMQEFEISRRKFSEKTNRLREAKDSAAAVKAELEYVKALSELTALVRSQPACAAVESALAVVTSTTVSTPLELGTQTCVAAEDYYFVLPSPTLDSSDNQATVEIDISAESTTNSFTTTSTQTPSVDADKFYPF
jgi:hypothetical protein